jgi:hypothetical protein
VETSPVFTGLAFSSLPTIKHNTTFAGCHYGFTNTGRIFFGFLRLALVNPTWKAN